MASLWELMAAREQDQMSQYADRQAQYAERTRQRQEQQSLRDAVANRPQQTTFAEPQQQPQQPRTLSGLLQGAPAMQADPSLTEVTGRQGVTPEQAAYEQLRTSDPMAAPDYASKILKAAHEIAAVGDHQGAVDYVNKSLGTKLKFVGAKDNLMMVANGDGTHTIYDIATGKDTLIGTPKPDKAKEEQKASSGFQSAIANLSGPTAMPNTQYPLGSTGLKTGYAPMSTVEGDIRLAGADYGAKGEDINKAVDDARSLYKETYIQGKRVKPKGAKSAYTPEYNLMGQQKDVGKTTDLTVNLNQGGADDVQAWAKAIKEGRANLQDVPNRGTVRSQVVKVLEQGGDKVDYAGNKADNSAYGATITQQQKQLGSMGSFVKNLDAQVAKVNDLSKELSTFDTRLLNIPLRAVRGRIVGSPQQAKYDMYLTEIESEIGKLATGSSSSAAELSIGAQQKWAKIHDKNLSIKDMMELLKETSAAGKLRMKSVQDQLDETKQQRRDRGTGGNSSKPTPKLSNRAQAVADRY